MPPTFFPRELAVMPTRNMKKDCRVFTKGSSDVQKRCVSVVKNIVVMLNRLTGTCLAAENSIKEQWRTVAMEFCQSTAKC